MVRRWAQLAVQAGAGAADGASPIVACPPLP